MAPFVFASIGKEGRKILEEDFKVDGIKFIAVKSGESDELHTGSKTALELDLNEQTLMGTFEFHRKFAEDKFSTVFSCIGPSAYFKLPNRHAFMTSMQPIFKHRRPIDFYISGRPASLEFMMKRAEGHVELNLNLLHERCSAMTKYVPSTSNFMLSFASMTRWMNATLSVGLKTVFQGRMFANTTVATEVGYHDLTAELKYANIADKHKRQKFVGTLHGNFPYRVEPALSLCYTVDAESAMFNVAAAMLYKISSTSWVKVRTIDMKKMAVAVSTQLSPSCTVKCVTRFEFRRPFTGINKLQYGMEAKIDISEVSKLDRFVNVLQMVAVCGGLLCML
ncbi:hypothetical protein GUITHDRAFT_105419 [Guillardia theta CCMP2712]|uniref:Uncharacterized protein n=1 Tax=Guillardia theta (strain CCMP2712) TaxID=905079 RepID=L1JKG6_GUITC|nr:hypothetical protein GUITHDRAFT_105419 [Guillardia theta CCMP2712]EKX48792.1 hypothetical protein GUITHDRAFT_105419 [Guillardia theta CCMP2712]|mmetsp:Transcript_32864/g.103923  ORF Transcript_32864/g.103923 Transcript_32864/m.103923 type:complete len:336 (-) Transcript_32864:154-1161(-)|eukprot:XP_005835772.1 hypothetical protein GUITHDRAFT_105419 [Guillardia theta CCMP2712]